MKESDKIVGGEIDIFAASQQEHLERPEIGSVSAGFPSPAADHLDLKIDLNTHIIKHPSATFFGRVKGDSMQDAGIEDGDLLVIDRSLEPSEDKIAVCFVDGEFTIKRLHLSPEGIWLVPANENYKPLLCTQDNDLRIWGIVSYVIKAF